MSYKEKVAKRKALFSLSNYLLKKTARRAEKLQERERKRQKAKDKK